MQSPKLIHYTEGGPYHGHFNQQYLREWFAEFEHMLTGNNPHAGYGERCKRNYIESTIVFSEQVQP